MKRACILLFLTMGFTGTSLDNKAEILVVNPVIYEPIKLDPVANQVKALDSLFNEISKHKHYEKHNK